MTKTIVQLVSIFALLLYTAGNTIAYLVQYYICIWILQSLQNHNVLMVMYNLLEVLEVMRVMYRSVLKEYGDGSVIIAGVLMMLELVCRQLGFSITSLSIHCNYTEFTHSPEETLLIYYRHILLYQQRVSSASHEHGTFSKKTMSESH